MLSLVGVLLPTFLPQSLRGTIAARSIARRSPDAVLFDEELSPATLVAESAAAAVQSALDDDKTCMSVEVFDDDGDLFLMETSVAMACAQAILESQEVACTVLLADLSAVSEASAQATSWPADYSKRLRLSTLENADDVEAGAVVMCGLAIEQQPDDLRRDALVWLRRASVSLCVNTRVPLLRFEADRYEPVFSLVPHRIQRELLRYEAMRFVGGFLSERIWVRPHPAAMVAANGNRGQRWQRTKRALAMSATVDSPALPTELVGTEEMGRTLVRRAYPGPWEVLLDVGFTGEYCLIDELPNRPTNTALTELITPNVKARTAALASALKALREANAGDAPDPRDSPSILPAAAGRAGAEVSSIVLGVVEVLSWAEISSGDAATLKLYEASTLLRQRCYADAVSFRSDEVAVHVLQPYTPDEANDARARTEGYGRLNGDVRGACLLVPGEDGIGALEQLSVQREATKDERSACAELLLARAVAEAGKHRQSWLVAELPPSLQVHGAAWLATAGFGPADDATPDDVKRAMGAGAVCRQLDTLAL